MSEPPDSVNGMTKSRSSDDVGHDASGTVGGAAEERGTEPAAEPAPQPRRPALSPSRAADFKQCPLLYRFRAIDRLPETPTKAQLRGTLVHSVLEQLFALPRAERVLSRARELLQPAWEDLRSARPEWPELFTDADPDGAEVGAWLESASKLVESYFGVEDPSRLEPESCELYVETELESGALLRGYIDRLDVAPQGQLRVVDYKTGSAPREVGEAKAMFQMKFYAVVLWRLRGVVPKQLKLIYLTDGQELAYTPEEGELRRFERTLEAIWEAIRRAGATGDFRPSPSKLCNWCDHKQYCPSYGGTPPEYPGWPADRLGTPSAPSEPAG